MDQKQRESAVFLKTYKRLPIEIERGEGASGEQVGAAQVGVA